MEDILLSIATPTIDQQSHLEAIDSYLDASRNKMAELRGERDKLATANAALIKAFRSLTFDCRQYSGFIGRYEREHTEVESLAGLGKRFDAIIETAEAAIAIAEAAATEKQ